MTSTAKKILDESLTLPQKEREELVGALSNSLEPVALSLEWEVEIARRMQKIENGEAIFHDAEDHIKKLQAQYDG